jgi:hypothetical protein
LPNSPFTGECERCDSDLATCENGTTLFTIDVKHGHYRFKNKSVAIYECPFPDNCLGGTSAGGASCLTGSFGALCELCENNYYLEGDSNTCEPCADATKGSNVMTLFIIAGVMGVLAIVVGSLAVYNAQRLSDYYMRNEERILQLSAKITALIVTMQIIVLVNENHRDLEGAMLPEPYGKFLDSLSFLALDMVEFVPLSCLFGRVGHLESLLVWTVGPLSGIALVSLIILVSKHEQRKVVSSRVYRKCRSLPVIIRPLPRPLPPDPYPPPLSHRIQLREYTCFGVILILPLISRAVLQTFRCVKYDEDDKYQYVQTKRVLFVDPDVDCGSSLYWQMKTYAIFMTIVWPVGVPLALIIWLAQLSSYLDPANVTEEEAIEQRKDNPHIVGSSIAFVALYHRPRYWYYEVVFNLQRRLILTCVVLVFENNGAFICFVLAVSIITTVSEREMNPHLDPFVGAFVYLMQWQILLCILAMLLMDANLTDDVGDMAVGMILMLVNICMALVVIFDTRGDVVREAREKAALRAKMIRKSIIGKRLTTRASLAASMFRKRWNSERDEEEDDEREQENEDENEAAAAVATEEGEEDEEDDNLYIGHDAEDGAGHMTNPMFRAWRNPSGEAKSCDPVVGGVSADEMSSIEMIATTVHGAAEVKNDDERGASEESGEVDIPPENVKLSTARDIAENEEVEISPEDGEVSMLNALSYPERDEEVDADSEDATEVVFDIAAAEADFSVVAENMTGAKEVDVPAENVEVSTLNAEESSESEVDIAAAEDAEPSVGGKAAATGLDEVYGASEDDAAGDTEVFNVIHDAINAGTLTEEDAHAMIDRATGDDGNVNVGMLTEIVDELQHSESQDEEENPSVSPSQKNMVMKYRAALYAAKWRSQSRLSAQEEEDLHSTFTDMLHDAIDAGTLTKEEAHALIDRATRDDGHVDARVIANIVDELQHGEI